MNDTAPPDDELARRIARADARRRRARAEPRSSLWTMAARVGAMGWLVVLPMVAGAGAGHLLDRRLGSGVTWALALMSLGLLAGGYGMWRSLREVTPSTEED